MKKPQAWEAVGAIFRLENQSEPASFRLLSMARVERQR